MNRQEHMDWCKVRALEYLDAGNVKEAVTSMMSDLTKHADAEGVGLTMAPLGMMALMSGNAAEARRFIEGFN
ncbi:MAG: hypothetical protein V3T77_09125 [Planctomycetota bacterium]